MNKLDANKLKMFFYFMFVAMFSQTAYAAGGLESATSEAGEIKTWFYGFLGVCAFIYLMYLGAMAWAEKKQWADFGMGAVKVAAVGGVLKLCDWAWGMFA